MMKPRNSERVQFSHHPNRGKKKKKEEKRNENLSTQQPKFTQGASTAQIYFILIGVVVVVVEGRHGWDRCFVAIKYR